ncbi:MAG: cytochrome c assembly protein, partial [Saprospiraceae bacterium]|nr:cytochrome c assembly protein [Saprospiraceae bacterium]
VMVVPRLTDSLHPGNGGNPAFGGEDLDNTLRTVFYPAIIAYTIIGYWMSQLLYRYLKLENKWRSG